MNSLAKPDKYDICVVGGGMVGLTLARLIAAELPQIKLCLIEKHAFPSDADTLYQPSFDSRSTALSMGSVELFEALDIWQKMRERATAILSVHVSDKGHIGSTDYDYSENQGDALGYVVENAWMGCCLFNTISRCSGLEIKAPGTVVGAEVKKDGILLSLNASVDMATGFAEQIFAELVIVADGADSSLRSLLDIDVDLKDYKQHAVIANVEFSEAHRGRAYERFTAEGPLALLPLGCNPEATSSALVYTRPEAKVEATMALGDKQFLQAIQLAFGYRLGKFIRVGKRHSYPLSLSVAKEQVRSSLVLVGNAAHFLHPVAGQGFNLALRDVAQLLAALKPEYQKRLNGEPHLAYGDLKLLQRYLQGQYRDQLATGFISDSFNRVFSSKNPLMQLGRNIGLISLELNDGLKRGVFAQMMGKTLAKAPLEILRSYAHFRA